MGARRSAQGWRLAAWVLPACLCWAAAGARSGEPHEVERQTREFRVFVDGKERGQCVMQLGVRDDGTERVRINSQLRFNYLVYDYRYASAGREVWKDGFLLELENSADYNGTRYLVKAAPAKNRLHVTVNGKATQNEADAWATSYWHLPGRLAQPAADEKRKVVPAAGQRSEPPAGPRVVPLLDSDKGRALRGKLQLVGEEAVNVAGKRETCAHYRLSGDVQVELWYDRTRRLVRQESIEEGHKTLLELVKVSDRQ